MSQSIGVVIPLHNKRAHVRRAVESVLRQTHRDLRLTVIDDGSTDGSAECIGEISDSRLSLIRTERHGPGAARNLGIRATEADWIGLLDADDEWHPAFLEKTVAVTQRFPEIVAVFTRIQLLNSAQAPLETADILIDDYHGARLRSGVAMTSSSVLLRKAVFVSMGGFREDHRYAEDIEAWFRLACEGPSYYIAEALSRIEVNDPGSTTRSLSPIERAAGLQMLLDSYEAYRRGGRIPSGQQRSCRAFMQEQRARLALYLFAAGRRVAGARVLLTGVPLGPGTWREYAECAWLALTRGRS
jgi:glycosyltransferase involved in cell wall biosynthesis